MKTLLAVVALLSVLTTRTWGLSDELKELVKMLHNQCRDAVGVDEDAIQKAQKGEINEDDEKLACYMKCIFVQSGAMGDDGTFDVETAVATLPPEVVDKLGGAIMACKDVDGPNPCMKAMKINECIRSKAPDVYFLP